MQVPRSNRSRRSRHKTRRGAPATSPKVKIKAHTRSPRGPDAGKKPVHVKGYRARRGTRR